jgi:hypothetical protein
VKNVEKIVVHCETREEWNKVVIKLGLNLDMWSDWWFSYGDSACINIQEKLKAGKKYYENDGYTIIPASEYLKEGGNEVEFKVGDRVENISSKHLGTIRAIEENPENCGIGVEWEAFEGGHDLAGLLNNYNGLWMYPKQIKLINKQIKEEVMKENNTDKNVTEVFGDLPHNEVVIIDKHFNDEMLKVILMNKFSKEIRKACSDAEDKLKEEEGI